MSFVAPTSIDLASFARGTQCLSPAMCAHLAEAAAKCLVDKGHVSGVTMAVDRCTVAVQWGQLDPRADASHADPQEATEDGAVAIAIELVRGGTALTVVQRSRKGTGFDWHLGPSSAGPPFQQTACLEVSGIFSESGPEMRRRVEEKVAQVAKGGKRLPGYAVVVGFGSPCAVVQAVP